MLYIIGSGEESYLEFLQELIRTSDLDGNIQLLGKVTEKEKYSYLARAHFLIHTSFREGFGLTVLEAGLMGTPSIVREGSNLQRLVSEGYNGFSVSSPQELADVFICNVGDSNVYSELSANAFSLAQRHNWETMLERSGEITGVS